MKIYHPDSKSPESNPENFQKVDEAYRKICKKISEDKQAEHVEQQKIFDIKVFIFLIYRFRLLFSVKSFDFSNIISIQHLSTDSI